MTSVLLLVVSKFYPKPSPCPLELPGQYVEVLNCWQEALQTLQLSHYNVYHIHVSNTNLYASASQALKEEGNFDSKVGVDSRSIIYFQSFFSTLTNICKYNVCGVRNR